MEEKSKIKIDFLNKEVEEANKILERQHTQIQWFVQVYLLALFGFFSVTGYLIVKSNSEIPVLSVNVIILVCAAIIFCLGWLLLSALSHKLSIMQMVYKHLATMRRRRIEEVDILLEEGYVFPLSDESVQMPGLIYYMPYLFFGLNYTLFCGSFFFVFHKQLSYVPALNLSFCIAILVGLFYPRVCMTFNKHMRASGDADTLPKKQYLEEMWEKKRKSGATKLGLFVKHGALFILTSLSIGITYFSINNIWNYNDFVYLAAGVVTLLVFGALRYFFETASLNLSIRLRFRL